ncbi:MAG TPA: DUF2252 domain-containing protein [Ilumatobacteraceae bacterium]|nr:DUF2252 domain-containing protein [Ilumatobacteraceae bacterium]
MEHLSVDDRIAIGRAARREVPRSSHAALDLDATRPDPVDLLQRQAVTRVPELVPIRYGRMLVSPFTFYRGAALVMASDLSRTPSSGLHTQVCGDAHLMNFGVFGSADRRLVFDINDFDETAVGPWEWDVKRLAASFAIAGRDIDLDAKQRRAVLLAMVGGYRTAMRDFAGKKHLDVWYSRLEVDQLLAELRDKIGRATRKRVQANLDKARSRDSSHALAKLTEVVDGRRRIISDPPLIQPIDELVEGVDHEVLRGDLHDLLRAYRSTLQPDRRHLLEGFRLEHAARKVVGVGSVGTRAWILLLSGRDGDDPLFLQAKEAQASVLEEFVGPSGLASNGERVVNGQHLMQATSDIFLGWQSFQGVDGVVRDYYLRQLKDWKGSADVETMTPRAMTIYARMCGWTLARAHARSGDRIAIAAYLGSGDVFDQAIADFSEAYADQNERDHDALVQAERTGRIDVQRGL